MGNNIFIEYIESGEAARVAEAVANSNSDYVVLTGTFITTYTSNACETSGAAGLTSIRSPVVPNGEWLVRFIDDGEDSPE